MAVMVVFLTVNFLDFLSTAIGIMSGRAEEANQFLNWMGGPFSFAGLIFKLAIFPLIVLLPTYWIINKYKNSEPALAMIATTCGVLGITVISNLRFVFAKTKKYAFYEFLNDKLVVKLDELDKKKSERQKRKRKRKEIYSLILTYILWYGFTYIPLWFLINYFLVGMNIAQISANGAFGIFLGLINPIGFMKILKLVKKDLRCN